MGQFGDPGKEKMEARPPELIEKIVGILIPAACREHVLGDLYERYSSPGQYILDALSVLPFLLASRIVRTFRLELLVAQASALYITFAGASIVAGPSYLYDKGALFPLALVIADALLVLLLCDAYADPRDGSARSAQLHAGVALASVWLLQVVLRLFNPALVLPVWIAAAGTAAAFPVLAMLRTMFRRHGSDAAVSGGLRVALDELRRNSEKQRKTAVRANQLWLVAAAIVFIVTPKVAPPSRWWAIGTGVFFATIIGAALFRVRNVLRYVKRNPYTDPLRSKRDGLLYQASGGLFSILSGTGPSLILCCIAVPLYLFAVRWMMNAPTPDVSLTRVRISLVAFGALCAAWALVRWLTLRAAETMTRELESRESMDDDGKK
jgi:hypothetical protein